MRFLGVMYRADGTAVDVSDTTPVGTLLDVIESLSDDLSREKARHAGTLRFNGSTIAREGRKGNRMKEGNGWKRVESGTLYLECTNSHKWTADIRFLGTGDFRCPQCGAQGGPKNVEKP